MTEATSRSAVPRLAPGTVARERLLQRLIDARHKACVLLLGPAGSGKTTLALQWRAQLLGYGYDFAWMTVMPGDDSEPLLDGLFAALNRVDANIAREAAFIYNRDSELRSPEAIAISLLKGLMQHPREIVLLVDDYQNVTDTRAHPLVQTLIDFAPAHFHLAMASRSLPPLSLSRLRDQGGVVEMDFRDLRFSTDEVENFVRMHHPALSAQDARHLYEVTDGWVAGLQLVSMDLKRKPDRARRAEPVQNAHDFMAYFNREVLSHLNLEVLDSLTHLSAAHRFNDALSAALLGAENGQRMMERLRREQMFMMPFNGGEGDGWYRFHPLFRDLLQERFRHMPSAAQRRTHATLGNWFGRRKLLREAVQHCVAAGDLQQATEWLERCAREMFLNGELRRLARAVSELPRSVLREHGSLGLWLAWSQLCYRHLAACHESIAVMKSQQSEGEGDVEAGAHWCLLAFSLALQEDDTGTAETLLPELAAMRHSSDAVLIGGRRNLLGWFHSHLGQFDRARQMLEGPQQYREDGSPLLDSAFGTMMGQCMRGFSYLHEGDVRHAEPVLRDALSASEKALGPYCEPACNAAAFLSAVLYEINDLPALRQLLETRYDVIERVTLPDALICAAIVRARQYRLEGSIQEALASLDRLEELAQRRHLDRLMAFALVERVNLYLQTGERLAAERILHTLRALARRHELSDSAASLKIRALAMLTQARWSMADAEEPHALEVLLQLQTQPGFARQKGDVVKARALQAVLHARLGQSREALRLIGEVLFDAQRLGLVRSLLDIGSECLQLAQQSVQGAQRDSIVAFYVERLKEQAGRRSRPDPKLSATLHEALSERELEMVRALANSMSNKRIAQALGVSPETVKWHLKNVYGKLGVYGRDDAVARARDLGLLLGGPV